MKSSHILFKWENQNQSENKKHDSTMSDEFKKYTIGAVLSAELSLSGFVGVCVCVCSHLGFLLDFEELRHVREVFLVGLSHLFLCCLWVHNLQPLQTREQALIKNQYLFI